MSRNWHRDRFIPCDSCTRVSCSECGVSYWLPKSKADKYPTCGVVCSKVRRERIVRERERRCAVCGEPFIPRSTQLAAGTGIYCSHKCQGVAQSGDGNPMHGKSITAEQRAKWRETRDINDSWLRGEKSTWWNGGAEAAAARRKQRVAEMVASGESARRRREYVAKNKLLVRELASNRKSRKVGRLPRGTVKKIGDFQQWKCAICSVCVKDSFHVDHVFPLSKGGKHEPRNIQILCPTCNVRKNAKDQIEYMQSIGRLI